MVSGHGEVRPQGVFLRAKGVFRRPRPDASAPKKRLFGSLPFFGVRCASAAFWQGVRQASARGVRPASASRVPVRASTQAARYPLRVRRIWWPMRVCAMCLVTILGPAFLPYRCERCVRCFSGLKNIFKRMCGPIPGKHCNCLQIPNPHP